MCPVLSRFCLNFTEIPVRCLSVRIFIKRRSDFWLLDFCLNFIHCQDCVRFSKKPYPLFVCPAGQGRDRRSVTELFGFSVLVSADVWHISLSPEAKQNICQDCWINCSRWTYSPKDRPQPKQFYTKKGSKANNLRVITKMTVIFENDFYSVPKWINGPFGIKWPKWPLLHRVQTEPRPGQDNSDSLFCSQATTCNLHWAIFRESLWIASPWRTLS